MIRRVLAFAVVLITVAALYPVYGKAPAELVEAVNVDILAAEAEAQSAKLGELLESQEKWDMLQKDRVGSRYVAQAGGIISVVAQTIAEHPKKGEVKLNPTALRAAGLAIQQAKTYEEALKAYAQVQAALAGMGDEGEVEYDWTRLTDLHNMMEEVNARSALLGRAVRRPRNIEESVRDASVLAVLAAVMEHDTDSVIEPSKIGQWKKYAETYRNSMLEAADALRKKDTATARKAYITGVRACDFCHEDFRAN